MIAIAITLIFVAALVTGYYFWTRGPPEGYSTISLLDANGKAENYPDLVIIGENNTFSVTINVENHMVKTLPFEVRVKITDPANTDFPVQSSRAQLFNIPPLENGGKWNTTATTTIDDPGNYMVVYELWAQNENSGALELTGNVCILKIEAINQS